MSHSNPAGTATDKEARLLLVRYQCPTPFHVVRTMFMGYIATPRLDVSPLATLTRIWGEEMPEFDSKVDVEEVARVLVHGLWNRLADHQNSRNPFRLLRFEVLPTRQALHDLALMRAEELAGFVDGLFGDDAELMLPKKAHEAMQALGDLYGMFGGAAELLADEEKAAAAHELKALLKNLQQLTIAADDLINKAIQSCKRARNQSLEAENVVATRRAAAFVIDEDGPDPDDLDEDLEPDFVDSALSQTVTRHGVTVNVEIYAAREGGWILEIVDASGTSHVWDDRFETDQQALDEALRALDEETLEFSGTHADRPLS